MMMSLSQELKFLPIGGWGVRHYYGEKIWARIHSKKGIPLLVSLRFFFGLLVWLQAAVGIAVVKSHLPADKFPMPPAVSDQVAFWMKIFNEYHGHQIVIHDTDDPRLIIDVINLQKLPPLKGIENLSKHKKREVLTKAYITRYQTAIERIAKDGKKALTHGAMEERIWKVYQKYGSNLLRLRQGGAKIRGQAGLADEFLRAAGRAQYYLPFMEKVFVNEGLPKEITRLAFVESMFNLKARSNVGASGIWQFMPDTARTYMNVNHLVDERNSPFKATRGAAKLLAENYRSLQSWPLAITAYNHGRGGMSGAVKSVRSRDIGRIIESFQSESFGFASKNFYAEFLAAATTFERLRKKGIIPTHKELSTSVIPVTLPSRWSVQKILKQLPIKIPTLKKYNSCLNESVFGFASHIPLPKNFEIYLPKDIAHQVRYSLGAYKNKQYAKRE